MRQPNILIFMTDQQRGDSIPPYSKAKTPYLDKFCKEGVTFSQAFCCAPHCCPSRASFFSGLYPSQHGVWNNVNVGNTLSKGLYEGVRLWSEDLKESGYDLHFAGKWHVSNVESPADRGWTTGFVTGNPTAGEKEKHRRRPQGREWKWYRDFQNDTSERKEGQIIRPGYPRYTHYGSNENPFNDQKVVASAISEIKSRNKGDKPWCQFVGTLGPHDPYFVPQKYLDMYDINDIELPGNFNDPMTDKPNLYRRTRDRFDQLTEREHREAIRHYLAFCSYEDALFGQILEALEESGDKDNTLVLYVSDHGDYMAEHGLWCKGLPCFQSAYHIPAALRWPNGIKNPGRVVDQFISIADFAPTFLELARINVERSMTGRSLVPFLMDENPEDWRDAIFTQSNGNELYGIQRSIMTKDWKFVYNGYDYDELYDLKNDPLETNNVAEDPAHKERIRTLSKRLWKFAYETDDICINPYIMVALSQYGPGEAFGNE